MSDTTIIERPAIDGAIVIPTNLLTASPTNPRKHFDAEKLAELADSIKKHTLLQPILARPHPNATAGAALYEIVAGERRWRASKLAEQPTVHAVVRDLTDFEVLEIQVIENLQRDDLTVLEEAEGYRALMRKPDGLQGYVTADELADRLGKSRRYVFNRMKLCDLVKEGRDALGEGTLSPSVALLVARLPSQHQPEAVKIVVQGWGGRPLSFREAQERLESEFMMQLSKAPFKITDGTLVPDAGSCRECVKRTGSNVDLFDDIKSADTCTDRKCFQLKTSTHHANVLQAGKEQGLEVITGAQAKKVIPQQYGATKGYLKLDEINYQLSGDKPLRKLLGKEAPPTVLVEDPHTHDVVEMVREADAIAVLKDKGVLKTGKMPSASSSEREAEARAKAATAWRTAAVAECLAAVMLPTIDATAFAAFIWPEVALCMWRGLGSDSERRAERLLGWEHVGCYDDAGMAVIRKRVEAMSSAELGRMLVAMVLVGDMHVGTYNAKPNDAPRISRFAKHLGVDVARVRRELAAPKKAKPAPASSAKGKSPPQKGAAAQGATSGPQTPEEALAKAVQTDQPGQPDKAQEEPVQKDEAASPRGQTSKASSVKAKATSQKVDAASPRAQASAKAKASTKQAEQKDDAASPLAEPLRKPGIGERWKQTGVAWPFPSGGIAGTVKSHAGDSVILVDDKGALHTLPADTLEPDTSKPRKAPKPTAKAEAQISPAVAWPFPKSPY